MVNAYITKYALSSGIVVLEGEVKKDMFVCKDRFMQTFHGLDWYLTEHEATARAENMKAKKLMALNRALKKTAALKF